MKKIHLFFAVIIVLLCSITGCKTSKADINVAESDNETETSEANVWERLIKNTNIKLQILFIEIS